MERATDTKAVQKKAPSISAGASERSPSFSSTTFSTRQQTRADSSTMVQRAYNLNAKANPASNQPVQRKPNQTGLPNQLKSGVERLSGHSMDDVKVHYNSSKPAQLNAHAYAQGTNIHLASGQEKHLPHEAWHVVQQKQGRVKPTMQLKANDAPTQLIHKGITTLVGAAIGGGIGHLADSALGTFGVDTGHALAGTGAAIGAGIGGHFGGGAPAHVGGHIAAAPAHVPAPVVNLRPQILANLNAARADRLVIRADLTVAFWGYQHNDPVVQDELDTLSGYYDHGIVNVIANDAIANVRAQALRHHMTQLRVWAAANRQKLSLIHEMYAHPGHAAVLPGVPTLLQIWQAVLGVAPPNTAQFNAYYATIKTAFGHHAKTGFDAAPDQAERFSHLMRMGEVSVGPRGKGVSGVYQSEFDARAGGFGAEWQVNGLPGWVLHGHGRLHDDERSFDLPRMHIKRAAAARALGASVVIDNEEVRDSVIASSRSHVSRLAKSRRHREIFRRDKSVIRSNRDTIY